MPVTMIIFASISLVIALAVQVWARTLPTKEQAVAKARQAYDEALRRGDKANAEKAGLQYYTEIRNRKPTLEDVKTIANDFSGIDKKGKESDAV